MRTGDNKEFSQKYGKMIKQLILDENPTPCPISGGKCFYTYPPHPISIHTRHTRFRARYAKQTSSKQRNGRRR